MVARAEARGVPASAADEGLASLPLARCAADNSGSLRIFGCTADIDIVTPGSDDWAVLTAPIRVQVHYDFASTLCYIAHRVMQRLAADLAALELTLDWQPLDLTRITGWARGAPVPDERRANVERVARELRVAVHCPPRWMHSRWAHAIALQLAGTPQEPVWRERVWTAVYERGLDVSAADGVDALLADANLPASPDDRIAQLAILDDVTRQAYDAGVTGVPTFMLGPWPMPGIQDDHTMRALLARFVSKQRPAAALH